jgi:hypothetical protein
VTPRWQGTKLPIRGVAEAEPGASRGESVDFIAEGAAGRGGGGPDVIMRLRARPEPSGEGGAPA